MKKKLHKVICYHGEYNTFIEAGIVENPTFKNEIYLSISAKHKNGDGIWFFRVDEAFIIVEALTRVLNTKFTGIILKEKLT